MLRSLNIFSIFYYSQYDTTFQFFNLEMIQDQHLAVTLRNFMESKEMLKILDVYSD